MNKKIRILYLMHIHWDWTKQRPQFLAEKLSEKYSVLVLYPYSFKRTLLANNPRNKVKAFPFLLIPLTATLSKFEKIRQVLSHIGFRVLQWLWKPNFVWVTGPQIDLPEFGPNTYKLIYDCMDDGLEMPQPEDMLEYIRENEKLLVERSSIVFCSSNNLKYVLSERYTLSVSPVVVHNACEPSELQGAKMSEGKDLSNTIGYIGGVSSWFDKKAIHLLVENFPDLLINLIGPVEKDLIPFFSDLPRVRLLGHIPHRRLIAHIADCDAMIMPFVPNELIRSVDPVKMYEYIYLGKTIYSIKYPELEKFKHFVEFYESHGELLQLIQKGLNSGFERKYSSQQQDEFIKKNTWDARFEAIQQVVKHSLLADKTES